MDPMNTFNQLWQNWVNGPRRFDPAPPETQVWLNELNQAVFSRLEKNLQGFVKVRTVTSPAFLFYTEAAGGYGVDAEAGMVVSRRVTLPEEGTFEEQVNAAIGSLTEMILQPGTRTTFFYSIIQPLGTLLCDGTQNRRHMVVRMMTTGDTVDVETK